ncbi:MAG: ComF family protein [Christensenellales bacterium]
MYAIDLFFPRQVKCIFCGKETKVFGICDDCYKLLPLIKNPTCHKCGGRMMAKGKVCVECKNRTTALDRCYSTLEYTNEIQRKIISFKQNSVKHIGETFSYLISDKFDEIEENIDIIIPVPIGKNRLKIRGFNQSEVLCNELKEKGNIVLNILVRPDDTPHQTGLGRKNRLANLKDAFKVTDKTKVKNKTILLVDDIYTTGSTLNECAKTLKNAGASKVIGLVLARASYKLDRVLDSENKDQKIVSLAFTNEDM